MSGQIDDGLKMLLEDIRDRLVRIEEDVARLGRWQARVTGWAAGVAATVSAVTTLIISWAKGGSSG